MMMRGGWLPRQKSDTKVWSGLGDGGRVEPLEGVVGPAEANVLISGDQPGLMLQDWLSHMTPANTHGSLESSQAGRVRGKGPDMEAEF
jgi:hypothetical protein